MITFHEHPLDAASPRRLVLTAVLIVIGAVITIDHVPGRRRAPCAAAVAEGRPKVLEMLRETVKVAIYARKESLDGRP